MTQCEGHLFHPPEHHPEPCSASAAVRPDAACLPCPGPWRPSPATGCSGPPGSASPHLMTGACLPPAPCPSEKDMVRLLLLAHWCVTLCEKVIASLTECPIAMVAYYVMWSINSLFNTVPYHHGDKVNKASLTVLCITLLPWWCVNNVKGDSLFNSALTKKITRQQPAFLLFWTRQKHVNADIAMDLSLARKLWQPCGVMGHCFFVFCF